VEVTQADFVGIPSTDFGRSTAFYVDTLGLEARGVRFDADFDSGVCHMAFFKDPDGNHLMLHNRYKPYDS
jgi:catechol 2,3-dioxygenase-like lactoylglutathione lyase family enzyme